MMARNNLTAGEVQMESHKEPLPPLWQWDYNGNQFISQW